MITVCGNTLYTINAPWGATEITYKSYNTINGQLLKTSFVSQSVAAPAGIAVHPKDNRIFISSYNLVGGYASYSTPGYVAAYRSDGTFLQKYETGVGPINMLFLD